MAASFILPRIPISFSSDERRRGKIDAELRRRVRRPRGGFGSSPAHSIGRRAQRMSSAATRAPQVALRGRRRLCVRSLLRSSPARALGKLALRTLPPLRPALNTWRARYETAELDTASAVLVYQMGKVGSGSVMHALKAEAVPAFHVHNLAPDQLARSGALHRNAFGRFDIDYTWYIGCALSRRIQAAPPGRRFRVITLVRDPIAREVSGIFQVPELYGTDLVDAERRFDVERV